MEIMQVNRIVYNKNTHDDADKWFKSKMNWYQQILN